MRARNIKPSLFKNEVLGVADPLLTILFEGLWCMADRLGRLEDRPLRIKAEIFPYRDGINIGQMLSWLDGNGFIQRYKVKGVALIQVTKFDDHQSPHKNEQDSVLPSITEADSHIYESEHNQGSAKAQPRQCHGRSDSGFLIADSGFLNPDPGTSSQTAAEPPQAGKKDSRETNFDWWLDFKLAYPNRAGDQGWRKAQRAAHARIQEGHTPNEFIDGAKRYANYLAAQHKVGTEFVKQACTFLGPEKPFLEPWTPPPTKGDIRQSANLDAAREFLNA